MSSWNRENQVPANASQNVPQLNELNIPQQSANRPTSQAMNPAYMAPSQVPYMPPSQVPYSAPPYMPQYYQNAGMPYQEMMPHPQYPMMYPMAGYSQNSGSILAPPRRPTFQNTGNLSMGNSQPLYSQYSYNIPVAQSMPYGQGQFSNEQNVSHFGMSQSYSGAALNTQNIPSSTQNTHNASASGNMASSKKYPTMSGNQSATASNEHNTQKRTADSSTDTSGNNAKWFKGEFQIRLKNEKSGPRAKPETKDIKVKKPLPEPNMRLLVGTVEEVLKWTAQKKDKICSAKILIHLVAVYVKMLNSDALHNLLLVKGNQPNSPSMQCVFYKIDRDMPYLVEGQTVVFTGHMKGSRKMQVFQFEVVTPDTIDDVVRARDLSERTVQNL